MSDAPALVIRRTLPVTRERVFDAWLNPRMLARFMRPGDMPESTVELDPRVGGAFKITMNHGGPDGAHWGKYLVIDRPSRLVFTWISAHTDKEETLVTVEFREKGKGTELVLTHSRLPNAKRNMHDEGWTEILNALGRAIAG